MTHSIKSVLLLALVFGAVGCRVGPDPAGSPAARSPRGLLVELRLTASEEAISGELIEVRDEGLVVLSSRQFVLVPFAALQSARSQSGPRRVRIRGSDVEGFEGWAAFSRHPYGLTEAQFNELLRLEGQAELVIVGS
jgi:hypothetical protein